MCCFAGKYPPWVQRQDMTTMIVVMVMVMVQVPKPGEKKLGVFQSSLLSGKLANSTLWLF